MASYLDPKETIFLLCDLQTKFRPAIHGFEHLAFTASKMIKLAKILGIEVVVTTQNSKALGPIDPEIDVQSLGSLLGLDVVDKKLFSMLTPEVMHFLEQHPSKRNIVLFGIEAHICILQTTIDLLSLNFDGRRHTVLIPQDGVSSTSAYELAAAIPLLRQAGALVSTSESIAFRLIGDAARPEFKAFQGWVKECKEGTKKAGEFLILGKEETSVSEEKGEETKVKSAM